MNEATPWDDRLRGRKARRETGLKVAPAIIRRPAGADDERLRRLYDSERGLPFTPTDKL